MINAVGDGWFREGSDVRLAPFFENLISDRYLEWINDPEVNRFSVRSRRPVRREDAERFVHSHDFVSSFVFAIEYKNFGHVGNIELCNIDWISRCGELRVVIGERSVWGKGIARQSISILTDFAFRDLNLVRLEAYSCNPAFACCVERLGWVREGCLRRRVYLDGVFHDYLAFGILVDEWRSLG